MRPKLSFTPLREPGTWRCSLCLEAQQRGGPAAGVVIDPAKHSEWHAK